MSSISSVSSPPPSKPIQASEPPRPDVKADADADDSRVAPPPPAPLPPGQGTRVNIFA
ncbi:MAG: hypothetical protein HXX15_01170 [Rhodopseudomonas sp.]|uniref:hypothetical protein n=1 Tax=Rhodopseudomonas sp. TaxID=1078 RepID=UPI00184BF124|nr:hypothetical protein [Rhodopseudomonas sp.]NVN84671.1 hypothetical protein [Rhodopseudomonas sp.]